MSRGDVAVPTSTGAQTISQPPHSSAVITTLPTNGRIAMPPRVLNVRCLVVPVVAVVSTAGFASIAQAQEGGAEVRPCTVFAPELVGVAVSTPSGHENGNCGFPGPAESIDGTGAFTAECSDLRPGETGRLVITPSGHEMGNCSPV